MADSAELKAMQNIQRWRDSPATMVRELFHVQPDPWQEEALELYPKCPRLALKASKGPGKAQPNHTLIWGPDGVKTFGSLRQGDLVFAGDGSFTMVRAIYERGVLPIYRIWFDDNSSTQVCGEHLWKVRGDTERRHDTWSILTTDEIITRGVRNKNGRWAGRHFEIPRQGPLQFSHAELPVDPYVIGIWIGDGVRLGGKYATKPTHEIQVEIERRGYRTSGPSGGIVAVHSIIGELRGLGLLPLYSYERFIPKPYLQASVAQRTDLICGLMDTDGGIDADGHMEFSTTSEMLAENFIWLARSLGGNAFRKNAVKKPFYYDQNRRKVMGRDCYRITVRLPFNPFRVPHRRSRWTDPTRSPSTLRYLTRKIDRIEPDGFAECRCIEVDHPDSLYLTDDALIVTHNTACLSWIAWNFLLTRPQPKVLATSISGDNLADGMWTEMDKWRGKCPLLQKHFEWTKTRIYHKGQYETTWWMAARQWSQSADKSQQANTLAGMHADYILFLLDESGGIPDPVMVTAEAALSSCVEGHIVQAGNPTHLSGPLYRAVNLERALWKVVEISGDPDDPKRSTRISMQWAQDMIKTWGRDHPYVLVNVLGRFPPSSFNALIGPDEVRDAQKRFYRDFEIGNAPKVLGVDVALFGDDQSVIAFRQGLQMLNFKKYRNLQPSMGASIVSREWEEYGAVAAFVDATGGAGSGWVDGLMLLGRAPIGVQFSGHAHENQRYANKRAEMYFDAVNWIKRGGALPPDDNLLAQLTATTYTYEKRGDRFLIEPKEMVKAKLNGNSPDEADAFCFVGNTLIATPNGDIRIRVIEEGDEVLTPLGVARVTKKWVTSVERLATVDFSNGEHLIGRPEHKVFAYKAGVIDLNALSLTMAVSPLSERQKWLNASELFTAIRSIGFKTAVGILAHEIPSTARGCCIAVSGQNVMDRFRTVLKSTTRIAIGAIARSTILNFSQRPITTPCTQPNAASLRNGRNEKTDISSWRQKRQSGGTQVPKDWSGIQKTALRVGKTENQPAALASDAEAPFGHTTQLEPSIAQKVARWLTPFGAILRTFGRAIGAARRLQQIVIGKQPVVPVSVQTENVLPTTVYNLTLDRDNAYYANGILVFNCLTFAEPVTAQDAKGRPRFTAEYNPFDGVNKSTASSSRHTSEYDPYRIF